MTHRSMARNLVAVALAGCSMVAPALATSAAPLAHVWVDDLRDMAPAGLADSSETTAGIPAAYDSALHLAMVVARPPVACNGCPDAGLNIWTSTGAGWSDLGAAPNSAPCPLGPSCSGGLDIAYDRLRQQIVGVGPCVYGTPNLCTWSWSGGHTWTLAASTGFSNTAEVALAYDPALSGTVMLACAVTGGSACGAPATYLWNGATWSTIATSGPSSPQFGTPFGTFAYDGARRDLVFAEQGPSPSATQTWVLRGTTWTLLSPATSPLLVPDMAYDPAEQVVVGVIPSSGNETWTWNGVDWHKEVVVDATAGGNLGNGIFAVTYDTTRRAVIGLDSNLLGAMTAVYRPLAWVQRAAGAARVECARGGSAWTPTPAPRTP